MRKVMGPILALLALTACSKDGGGATTQTQTIANAAGQSVEVTLLRVIDPAADTAELGDGNRYVAVEFSVTNTSDEPFTETRPDSDSVLITTASDDPVTADLHEVSDCAPFAEDVTEVAPGDGLTGCVTFEVPADAELERFQYYFSNVASFEL